MARADAGEYPPGASMELPHVQGAVTEARDEHGTGLGGLRKVEMPQLDRREDAIAEVATGRYPAVTLEKQLLNMIGNLV